MGDLGSGTKSEKGISVDSTKNRGQLDGSRRRQWRVVRLMKHMNRSLQLGKSAEAIHHSRGAPKEGRWSWKGKGEVE